MRNDIDQACMEITATGKFEPSEIAAAAEYVRRRDRLSNPPGRFDRAGRFYAEERTRSVLTCRAPSRKWPWPEMKAARTAAHCAEIFGVNALHVKRAAKTIDKITAEIDAFENQTIYAIAAE